MYNVNVILQSYHYCNKNHINIGTLTIKQSESIMDVVVEKNAECGNGGVWR